MKAFMITSLAITCTALMAQEGDHRITAKGDGSNIVPVGSTEAGAGYETAAGKSETKAEHDARMAWWREAKFGLFIHWSLSSG